MAVPDRSAFVVVDMWRAKQGRREELERVLVDSGRIFREQPGVLSVDFTSLEGDSDCYLVVFRYADAAAREAFVTTRVLKSTLAALSELWDLESPIYMGRPIEAG